MIKRKKYLIIILIILLLLNIFLNIRLINKDINNNKIIKSQQKQILYQENQLRKNNLKKYNDFLRKQEIEKIEDKIKND